MPKTSSSNPQNQQPLGTSGNDANGQEQPPSSSPSSGAIGQEQQQQQQQQDAAQDQSLDPAAREERIRNAAYDAYVRRDGAAGDDVQDWLDAESQVDGRKG
jgi:hypothetical protein